MQPIYFFMETKIIDHKLKKIQITYGYNDNAWTDEDEALVQSLLKAYDLQLKLDEKVKKLFTDFCAADRRINTCRDELVKLTEKIDSVIETANEYMEKIGFPRPATFNDFLLSITDVSAAVTDFDPPFRALDEDMDGLLERLNEWIEYTNHEFDEDSDFTIAKDKHFDNYENNSIDIVKFDLEEEMLEACETVHNDSRRSSIDHCNEIYADYKCLVLEITVQYERWKEFCQRLILLQYVFKESGVLPNVFAN